MTKKSKQHPNVKHNYKRFALGEDGPKFWARDIEDAKLYCEKIGWSPLGLKEITQIKEMDEN